MTGKGNKIIDGLKDAVAGNFVAVTIDGERWVKAPLPSRIPDPHYNDGLTHEALHTAFVLMETWHEHVLDSRCARHFPEVAEAAKRVSEAMHEAYQVIGAHFEDRPKSQRCTECNCGDDSANCNLPEPPK